MKTLKYTFIFLTLALFAGCSNSPMNPIGNANDNNGDRPNPTTPGGHSNVLGLIKVTIGGIGTGHMTATAQSISPRKVVPGAASNMTLPGGSGSDHTIQLKFLSNETFTYGNRPPGGDGVRYFYTTFKVRNADKNGDPYTTARKNLTFLAVDMGGAGQLETYGNTAVSKLSLYDGSTPTSPLDIAKGIIPTGKVELDGGGQLSASFPDVLQVYKESEVQAVQDNLPSGITVNDIFPWGFVVRSSASDGRTLSASPGSKDYEGTVTFAFKMPLKAVKTDNPTQITMVFLAVDDGVTRITRSIAEAKHGGEANFEQQAAAIGATEVTLLGQTPYNGTIPSRIICGARVAGVNGSATATQSGGKGCSEGHKPVITGNTGFSVDENQTTAGTVTATSPGGNALTYSISGGADQALFTIGSTDGKLDFKAAPDFESPADADADNVYDVQVKVSDGTLTAAQNITVTVQDVSEAPKLKSAVIIVNNQTFTAAESNGTYVFDAIPSGIDLTQFTITFATTVDPFTPLVINGGGQHFSVSNTIVSNDGLSLNKQALDYNHSSHGNSHQYQFSFVFENTAGQTAAFTFIIPVQPFACGTGTAADPYCVATLNQLQTVGQFLDAHFIQIQDIDANPTSYTNWHNNGSKGFDPIGTGTDPFTGTYDGQGHTITGLTIDRQLTHVGLFGVVGAGGKVKDVHVVNADISGLHDVGGLAGNNQGTIMGSSAGGSITGTDDVGGLVGQNEGSISGSHASGTTTSPSGNAGGLVGHNVGSGSITASSATGDVNGKDGVGGLVGMNYGTIQTSYATGSVTGTTYVGGLAGNNIGGTIETSYATGKVTGDRDVGGLVGHSKGGIQFTYATGDVNGNNEVGSLVGYSEDIIEKSYAAGSVSASGFHVGGLVGFNDGGTNDCKGLTTAQMQGTNAQTNMTSFDFVNVWQTNPGDYPTLRDNP